MKKTFFLFIFFLTAPFIWAQPTQAEIDKMLKKAQLEIDKMKNDPKNKDLINNMPDMDSLLKSMSNEALSNIPKNVITDPTSFKLPARNDKLLNTIPRKNLSRQELINFLVALHSALEKKLPLIKVQAAQAIINKLNKDAAKIALAGSLAWYKSAPAEAVLLVTYAASISPDDNTLNNCGAILNLCGLEEKAIPVLKYALVNQPENSTLLNNIGQAYAGLGLIDTAIYYLRGCITRSSTHPEACATVAYIEAQKGNIEKAKQMAEQAIKGGYGTTIVQFYKKINKDANLLPLLEDKINPNEQYFEMGDWKFPPLCHSWQEMENVYPKRQAFVKKADELIKHFQEVIGAGAVPEFKNTREILVWSLSQKINTCPMAKPAQALEDAFMDLYADGKQEAYMEWLNKFTTSDFDQAKDEIAFSQKWGELLQHAGSNIEPLLVQECKEKKAMEDKHLANRAGFTAQYRDQRWQKDIQFYNNMVFLSQFTAPNEQTFKSVCAAYAIMILNDFKIYAGDADKSCTPTNKPNCGDYDPAKAENSGKPVFTEANCPIDMEIPFGVGKMSVNCSRYELEMGEGVILNFEKKFNTRESTVAIGIGIASFIPGIHGAEHSPLEVHVKEQLYIKFDKDNQPSDLGMLWETELEVKGLANPDIKTGYTIGINSGYNFQEGPLKGILN
ncbi:MAG: tetratricopeptide repeat protein [Chitinophagales bacterium]